MSNHRSNCGECDDAARIAGALRCLRDLPKNASGEPDRATRVAAPLCENERRDGRLACRMLGTCGKEARFWRYFRDRVPNDGPDTVPLAVHYGHDQRLDVIAFDSRAARDRRVERIGSDDLIYAAVDLPLRWRVP